MINEDEQSEFEEQTLAYQKYLKTNPLSNRIYCFYRLFLLLLLTAVFQLLIYTARNFSVSLDDYVKPKLSFPASSSLLLRSSLSPVVSCPVSEFLGKS